MSTRDRHGYYSSGDYRTFSKLEAVEHGRRFGKTPTWHYNEDVFAAVDWLHEPPFSLWEIYLARARQIRAAYDHVALWYSGGADSTNILQAFISAGCKIDEIVTVWSYETTGERDSYMNAEVTRVVLPMIKRLQDQGIAFKFTLLEMPRYSMILLKEHAAELEYMVNYHFSVNNAAKHIMRDRVPHWQDAIASGKRMAFVWGKDKPCIRYENGRPYATFPDMLDDCVGPYTQKRDGWYDEMFYWSPDMPSMVCKAAHSLLGFIRGCDDPQFYTKNAMVCTHGYNPRLQMNLTRWAANRVLYPKWNGLTFSTGKWPSIVYSKRDDWLLDSSLEEAKRYLEITDHYFDTVDPTPRAERKNVKPFYSGRYWLE